MVDCCPPRLLKHDRSIKHWNWTSEFFRLNIGTSDIGRFTRIGHSLPCRLSSCTCSGREHLGTVGMGTFAGQMSYLTPNQQCQTTEGNSRALIRTDKDHILPDSSFSHHWTPEESVVAPLISVVQSQYSVLCTCIYVYGCPME